MGVDDVQGPTLIGQRRSAGRAPGRRRAGVLLSAALASAALAAAGSAEASRFPPRADLRREATASPRFKAARVGWQKALTEREILEFQPRELAGPALESFSGDLITANRRGKLLLLDSRGREIWTVALGAAPTSTPAMTEDGIFVGTADGNFHAFDRFNGEALWSVNLSAQVLSPAVVRDEGIFVGTDHDEIHALDPATGEALWIYRRSTPTQLSLRGGSAVAVEEGRVFAGFSDGALVALAAEDGRLLWQVNPAAGSLEKFPDSDAAPIVQDGVVYATVFNDGVYAYEAGTGKLRWRADAQGAHSLALAGDLLLVGGARKALGLQLATGAQLWSLDLGKSYVVKPVVSGQVALLAGPDGIAFVVSETGRPLGRFFPGSGFSAPPAVNGAEIYALSDLGFLYELELLAGPR